MTPDRRKLIVNDALKNFSFTKQGKKDDVLLLLEKVERAIAYTTRTIRSVVQAGGAVKEEDRKGPLRDLVFRTLIERLNELSRDELLDVCTILVAERIMADVEADPLGKGKPDLLSGQ